MSSNVFDKLTPFLNELEQRGISYNPGSQSRSSSYGNGRCAR